MRQGHRRAARFLLDDMVEDVLDRVEFMRLEPKRVLLIGDWTGTLGLSLSRYGANVEEADVGTLDEEEPVPEGQYDLIVSLSSLDRVNDLPGALLHLRNALSDQGILLASMVGAGSLQNLRRAMIAAEPDRPAARMHPLIDSSSATGLMERALFRRQVVDSRTLTVAYRSLDKLVSDLRDQGLGSVLSDPAPPLAKLAHSRAKGEFLRHADANGRVLEDFEILTLTGWKS